MAAVGIDKFEITADEQPVFIVTVDPQVAKFTWEITDESGKRRERHVVTRAIGEPGGVHTIAAKPLGSVGDYRVNVYLGVMAGRGKANAVPAASASLSVVSESPRESGTQDPLGLATSQASWEPARDDRQRLVDFLEFQAQIERQAGLPVATGNPYEVLVTQAVDFVREHRVTDLHDLFPEGSHASADTAPLPGLPTPAGGWPAVELIWNYWLEEGMLMQTLKVIVARYQNRRLPGKQPLARLDLSPLLPLSNLLWGYGHDKVHRTTLRRRAAEYEYEYGLSLTGRGSARCVESRKRFLAAFHHVIHIAHKYYRATDDLTVQADALPLYHALRDCHVVLSRGSHNQYGEMSIAARAEFLVAQLILADPELQVSLGAPPMVAYPQPWMGRVDCMKSIQGWDDTSVTHYFELATLGEQLLLTIRLGNWAQPGVGTVEAQSWGQFFRGSVQRYTAAYRTVTGVNLRREATAELPSRLIARKVTRQR